MNKKVSEFGSIRLGNALIKQIIYRCVPSGCVIQSVDIQENVIFVEIEWMGKKEDFPFYCIQEMWHEVGGEDIARLELKIVTPYRDFLFRWWYTLDRKSQGILLAVAIGLLWNTFGFWRMLLVVALGVGGYLLGSAAETSGGWREFLKKLYPFR